MLSPGGQQTRSGPLQRPDCDHWLVNAYRLGVLQLVHYSTWILATNGKMLQTRKCQVYDIVAPRAHVFSERALHLH